MNNHEHTITLSESEFQLLCRVVNHTTISGQEAPILTMIMGKMQKTLMPPQVEKFDENEVKDEACNNEGNC